MKSIKIITLLLGVILLNSCSSKKNMDIEYTMVYKVYFTPTEVRTYTETIIGDETGGIFLRSNRGTNYIYTQTCDDYYKGEFHYPFQSSAPIEVVSYTKKKIVEEVSHKK